MYTSNNIILQKILNTQRELQNKREELLTSIQLKSNYIHWKSKIYVLSNTILLVLKEYYDFLLIKHFSYKKTLEMIQYKF